MQHIRGTATAIGIALVAQARAMAAEIPEVPGQWQTAAPLPEERTEVSVTTDGERLFLLGGFARSDAGRASAPRAVYAYDPQGDAWSHLTDLPEGVNHAGLAHVCKVPRLVMRVREPLYPFRLREGRGRSD
jgi:N-acetylneuraminic acid mutarotase